MKILQRYTWMSLKVNRRRTVFTILGVVISVAMITAVAVFSASFLDYLERKAIYETGSWDLAYSELSERQIEGLRGDSRIKSSFIVDDLGYAELSDSMNEYKPYLFVRAMDEKGFDKAGVHLVSGRLPENHSELAVSQHILDNAGVHLELGQTLTLSLGQRAADDGSPLNQNNPYDKEEPEAIINTQTKTYTIVGIIERMDGEPRWAPGYTVLSFRQESDPVTSPVFYLTLHHSGNDPQTQFPQLNEKLYPPGGANNNVLRFRGPFWDNSYFTSIAAAAFLALSIIISGSVFLIYNAFAISLSERSRQFGLLASIGATGRQKFWCAVQEALLIAGIAIPLGLLGGYIGMAVTLRVVNPLLQSMHYLESQVDLRAVMNIPATCITVFCSLAMILAACWRPALKAARTTPIQAIRQAQDVRLRKQRLHVGRGLRRIVGIEGELAVKNMRRSGRKAVTTILSLAVSLILFTTVSAFLSMFMQVAGNAADIREFDVSVADYSTHSVAENKDSFERIEALDMVDHFQRVSTTYGMTDISGEALDGLWDRDQRELVDFSRLTVRIIALDSDSYTQVLKTAQVEDSQMTAAGEEIPAIVLNQYRSRSRSEDGQLQITDIPIFSQLPKQLNVTLDADERELKFKPLALSRDLGLIDSSQTLQVMTILIRSEELEKVLFSSDGSRMYNDALLLKAKSGQADVLLKEVQRISDESPGRSFSIYSPVQDQKEQQILLLVVSIFVYGFITLICMICLLNVINTISTNVDLRRKEFAMLRSVGMDPKAFNRMIRMESLLYGLGAILIGLPVCLLLIRLLYVNLIGGQVLISYQTPWATLIAGMVILILMVSAMMAYATHKIKKENIIETLKEEG